MAPDDRDRVLFEPTGEGIAETLRRTLADGDAPPARAAFDDDDSLRRWEDVLSLPAQPLPPAGATAGTVGPEWLLLQDDADVPEPELVDTLVRAQQVSGADVVTCGLFVGQAVHLFPGEPGALGLLGNGYGTVALVRRSLLGPDATDARWPLLAKLSVRSARIVSVPIPLVSSAAPPASLDTHPTEALRVMEYFEEALPRDLRSLAELVTRTAAEPPGPAVPRARSAARRAVRRFVRRWLR